MRGAMETGSGRFGSQGRRGLLRSHLHPVMEKSSVQLQTWRMASRETVRYGRNSAANMFLLHCSPFVHNQTSGPSQSADLLWGYQELLRLE
jgi:hypothetical protein